MSITGGRSLPLFGLVALGLIALSFSPARAAEEKKPGKETAAKKDRKESDEGQETRVSMAKVPAAVRKTLKREANGAGIDKVDVEKRNGKTVYETDVEIDGQNYEILVAADGKLISKMIDNEAEEKEARSGKPAKDDRDRGDAKKSSKAKSVKEGEDEDDDARPVKAKAKKEAKEENAKSEKKGKDGKDAKAEKEEDEK
jgi:hypothetical protein